jgi:diadenylate cyclase
MADFLKPDILDVLDILLVSFLIYRLLLLIQGTRAARMVLGLTLILVGSVIAQWLNLRGTNWIIGSVKVAWVVAVAIIFQPEIRRALTQLGHNPLIRRILKVEHPQALDEVAEGAALLSARGEGGLIVLERNTGLKTYASTGKPINAKATAELITTIFTPGSPLHDGAVIVRGDEVVAASCILPLTSTVGKRRTMGMRHMAALGISEETDAVAVVVSEETHRVSLAVNGMMEKGLEHERLRTRLKQLMEER